MSRFTPERIARQRLAGQHLLRPAHDDPAAVVAGLGAVQARDYHGAKWALGLRMLVGEWRRADRGRQRVVRLRVRAPLTRAEEGALRGAPQRYQAFLGAPVVAERV